MSLQQAEGENLWDKSMVMPRQALRRTVASVPWRDRLAGILVLLLTATGLLVTPTFGDNREEIREYRYRMRQEIREYTHRMRLEMLKRMMECNSAGTLKQIAKCKKEAIRIFEECTQKPGICGAIEEPPQPVPVSCPPEHDATPEGDCRPKASEGEQASCPEGTTEVKVQDIPPDLAKEVAEDLVIWYGVEGAYERVNRGIDRGEIKFRDASVLFLAIGAIAEDEQRAPRILARIGGAPFIGTMREVRRRQRQEEIATELAMGTLRTRGGFLASCLSGITQWAGGSKEAQFLAGTIGQIFGARARLDAGATGPRSASGEDRVLGQRRLVIPPQGPERQVGGIPAPDWIK